MIRAGILRLQWPAFLRKRDGPDRGSDGACRSSGHHLESDSMIRNRLVGPTLFPLVERLYQKVEDTGRIRSRRNRSKYRKANLQFFLRQIRHKPDSKSKYRTCCTTLRNGASEAGLTKIISDDCDSEDAL